MLTNFLNLTFRRLWKKRGYSFVNIGGMAVAMTCCLLIVSHIQTELSYDKFHSNSENIYRLNLGNMHSGSRSAVSSGAMAPAFSPDYPEIEKFVRFRKFPSLVEKEDIQFYEDAFFYTDSTVFEVFDFELAEGNPGTVLDEPYTVVLTEDAALKYFGEENPIGQPLEIDNQFSFKVTGILKEVPENAHFQFDFLASIASLRNHPDISVRHWQLNTWYSHYYHTYLLLNEGTDAQALGDKLEGIAKEYSNPEYYEMYGQTMGLYIQPLEEIHLNAVYGEMEPQGNMKNLYIFGIVGLIILLIAAFNYANMATAQALQRNKEIGVRKVLGAGGGQLTLPFFGESFLVSGISALLAFAILQMGAGIWEQISGSEFHFGMGLLPAGLLIFVLTGILGGLYPAYVGKSFRPAQIFRKDTQKIAGVPVVKGLVGLQFALSLGLIVGTLVVNQQLQYMQNQPLGMEIDEVLVLPTRANTEVTQKFPAFEQELKKNPEISATTMSELVPGQQIFGFTCRFEGMESGRDFQTNPVSYDYFKTYGMEVLAGRVFSREISTDTLERAVINESLARELGWSDPQEAIGKTYDFGNDGEDVGFVIGVVKDVHFHSLRQDIRPLLFMMNDHFYRNISLRLATTNLPETIASIESKWIQFFPDIPFEYFFADEHFGKQYASDQQLAKLFSFFSSLSILLACIGLFGLSAFAVSQRVKEIGIRKVLGATTTGIVGLLSKDFLKPVLIALVIASPIAYYLMDNWLADFAYRIDIAWWVFVLAGVLAVVIAFLTVGIQSMKAALANPVDSLRSE